MIYVIVKESGSYSDYTMQVLYASTDEQLANAKLAEIEKYQQLYMDCEMAAAKARNEYTSNNKPPYHEMEKIYHETLNKELIKVNIPNELSLILTNSDDITFSIIETEELK